MRLEKRMYSFEFFPPKDVAGEDRLWAALSSLATLHPDFVAVTYGAGGGTRDRTIRITSEITARTSIPTVAHLTCVGSTRDELIDVLHKYTESGIKSILALRGDPVGGPRAPWTPVDGGLTHADELISLAREHGDFTIGVAAFPDGHPNSEGDIGKDIDVLLRKESLGASFATTQFFFEVDKWKRLVDSMAARGSSMPIIAGVLPVTNVKLLTKMAELGGTPIPDSIASRFAAVQDNPEDVRKLGVEIALNLCNDLIDAGVPGIHFYTMNSSTATSEIFESLQDRR